MSDSAASSWTDKCVRDLVERYFCGPSPDCEERQVFADDEWGVLKTTAITWDGWNERAHKVLPRAYWHLPHLEVAAGDVLVTKAGPRHRVGVVTHVPATRGQLVVSGKMIGLRPRRDLIEPAILSGLISLARSQKYIQERTTGMAESQVNFANEVLLDTPLSVPPIVEQRVIARICSALDTAIRQTKAIIAKLTQVKQGLLHDLLTRGIDANDELRPPQSQAPHLYKQSPVGWIPTEWSIASVGEVGEVVTGCTPPSIDAQAWGQHMPFITPADVLDDRSISSAERSVSRRGARYVRCLPPETTMVVCIGSTIGKIGLTAVESCSNQQINAVIPLPTVIAHYLHIAMAVNIAQLRGMAGLQAVPIVNKTSFSQMLIPLAPLAEQQQIADRVMAVSRRISAEEEILIKLDEQKSGLIDDLLSGCVCVTPLLESAATP